MLRKLRRLYCRLFGLHSNMLEEGDYRDCYCDLGKEIHIAARTSTEHDSLRRTKRLTISKPVEDEDILDYDEISFEDGPSYQERPAGFSERSIHERLDSIAKAANEFRATKNIVKRKEKKKE